MLMSRVDLDQCTLRQSTTPSSHHHLPTARGHSEVKMLLILK